MEQFWAQQINLLKYMVSNNIMSEQVSAIMGLLNTNYLLELCIILMEDCDCATNTLLTIPHFAIEYFSNIQKK